MGVIDILAEINRLGASVSVEGENIKITPKKVLTDGLRGAIRAYKPQILNLLKNEDAQADIGSYYPLLKKRVLTPKGPGVLWQVFISRIGVVLDKDPGRVMFFNPEDSGFYILSMDGEDQASAGKKGINQRE